MTDFDLERASILKGEFLAKIGKKMEEYIRETEHQNGLDSFSKLFKNSEEIIFDFGTYLQTDDLDKK